MKVKGFWNLGLRVKGIEQGEFGEIKDVITVE